MNKIRLHKFIKPLSFLLGFLGIVILLIVLQNHQQNRQLTNEEESDLIVIENCISLEQQSALNAEDSEDFEKNICFSKQSFILFQYNSVTIVKFTSTDTPVIQDNFILLHSDLPPPGRLI